MDMISYSLSKKIAASAVSGVSSMSVDGTTLNIDTNDGQRLQMVFPQPKDGLSVTDIDVNANNQIVFTMSDGTEFISGKIPTLKGDAGFSPTITENADNTDKIYKLDITTADSTFTTPNLKGADGTGGTGASTWSEISDKPFESLSTDFSVENGELKVVGGTGGGEENKIDSISVNGVNVSPDENKNVDITVPSIEGLTKDADLSTVAKSGSYEDLINKPTIPDITGLATETYVDNKVADYTKTADLADVATSGSYNDLADKPTIPSLDGYAKTTEIPTKVSQLENDSNYLSSIPEEYVTDTELEAKGYLTEHQDISGKVDKVEGKSLISDTEIARLASVDNYDDTDIKAEIAKKADTTAIPRKVSELTNDSNYQTAEQVNSTVTTEIAKVVADAPEDLNTLKEMSDWIAGHENDASAMNSAISDNKTAITALQTGKADKSDIPTTVTELTDSADYAKTADVNNSISTLQTGKANASDLTAHTDDADIHVTAENKATWNTVSDKVDKEDGKGLSANDYTNEEKALVGTIEDKINKTSIVTALDDTVTDEQVASALLAKTELDKKVDKTSIVTELSEESTDDEVVGALTAYNELQKLESANKEQFGIASGDYITVNDSVDGKLVELGVKGNSVQNSYTGKNILHNVLNPTYNYTGTDGSTITTTVDGDVITVTNTEKTGGGFSNHYAWIWASREENLIDISKYVGQKLTFSIDVISGSMTQRWLGFMVSSYKNITDASTSIKYLYNSPSSLPTAGLYNCGTLEVTQDFIDTNGKYIGVNYWISNNNIHTNFKFRTQIEVGDTATEYEPYVGGIPAPSPLYPQAINSVGDDGSLVVKSCGKNLIPFPYYNGSDTRNGITATVNNNDGSITLNGTATNNYFFVLLHRNYNGKGFARQFRGKTVTISGGTASPVLSFAVYDENGNNITPPKNEMIYDFGSGITVTIPDNACDIYSYYYFSSGNAVDVTLRPQLEVSNVVTEYEPYKSSTTTIPLSEPLRSIGDIKDEITYQDGKWGILRRIKEINLTDLAWELVNNGTYQYWRYSVNDGKEASSYNTIANIIAEKYMASSWYNTVQLNSATNAIAYGFNANNTSSKLIAVHNGSTTESPTGKFLYELVTPTFEPFADQTLPYLSTYDGVTNISNDDALSAEMTVKYPTTDASGVVSRNESRIADIDKNKVDKSSVVTTLGSSSTDTQVPSAKAVWNKSKNKIQRLLDGVDIIVYADSISNELATDTVRIMNATNSPYGVDNVNNDFHYTIYNVNDDKYKRILAYDIRKNDMYMIMKKDGMWGTWAKLATMDKLGGLTFSASGTTLSITDGKNTWTLEANS